MFDYIISGIVAVFLLVYLGWAMFQPEKFVGGTGEPVEAHD